MAATVRVAHARGVRHRSSDEREQTLDLQEARVAPHRPDRRTVVNGGPAAHAPTQRPAPPRTPAVAGPRLVTPPAPMGSTAKTRQPAPPATSTPATRPVPVPRNVPPARLALLRASSGSSARGCGR